MKRAALYFLAFVVIGWALDEAAASWSEHLDREADTELEQWSSGK